MNKHIVWAISLFMITFIICCTMIWINYNSWTLRFEMDDNTLEAIESIGWEEINNPDGEKRCVKLKEEIEDLWNNGEGIIFPRDFNIVDCETKIRGKK